MAATFQQTAALCGDGSAAVTNTITVVIRQDSGGILPVEVDVLQRHGEWALVQHDMEHTVEPYCTVTHVPSGLALVHVYSFEIERTKRMLHLLPACPAGLPCMMPQTIEDSDEMRNLATHAPCAAELKAWVRIWKETVGR